MLDLDRDGRSLSRAAMTKNKNSDQPPASAATLQTMVPAAQPDPQWSNVRPFPKERFCDAELVAAVAQGDHRALETVWNRYAGAVRSTLFSALGPDHSIEDLIQDVFISFFRGAARLQNPAALKPYLLGSAVRIAAFERRTRGRRSKWLGVFREARAQAAEAQLPDVEQGEVLAALRRILDQVSERPRTAFILRYVEDLTVSDIAIALQTSEATAKRDVARGRARVLLLAGKEPTLCDFLKYLGGNGS